MEVLHILYHYQFNQMNNLTSKEYIKHVIELQELELDITAAKNADYSWDTLAFKNFDMVERLGICSAETGILVRMTDKMSRIINLIENNGDNKVKDEKINDTLTDLVNYARILNIYLLTKNQVTWTQESIIDMQSDS